MRRSRITTFALALLAGCGDREPPAQAAAEAPTAAASVQLPDSLALRAPDGTELWFTASRTAVGADSMPCVERVMELRRDSLRLPVPLLYTGERPTLVNDTLAETHIFLNCTPGNLYRINLRTGQPIYVGRKPDARE